MVSKEKKLKYSTIILKTLIIILILHLILILTKCNVLVEEKNLKEIPINISKQVTVTDEDCIETEFNWAYAWDGWQQEYNNTITPKFRLANYESRAGTFYIDFAFFDNATYPFPNYEGKNYEIVKKELKWEKASMRVNNVQKTLGPNEKTIFAPSVKKINAENVYWVYADVKVPTYNNCIKTKNNVRINKTIMINKSYNKKIIKRLSLWELLFSK